MVMDNPEVKRALDKVNRIYDEMTRANRWGETRRFAGRRAGNRLERLEKAKKQLSRAIDRAKVQEGASVDENTNRTSTAVQAKGRNGKKRQ